MLISKRLGFGVHGIIFAARGKVENGRTAIKVHREKEPYLREKMACERLKAAHIRNTLGFSVPQLIHFDDTLLIIQMSIVTRPFVLDFAGAYLDFPPDFSDEIWEEWEKGKQEQFETLWPQVKKVLAALEELEIYMVDVSPSNIAF